MVGTEQKLRDYFSKAVQCQTPEELVAYLEQACQGDAELRARLEELLQAHREAGSFLQESSAAPPQTVDEPRISERPGTVIGPYKLLQQIGEGGMGTVFMAEQTHPVQRKVALKVIKAGMDSRQVIARFEAERQALAMMDHVNIARVLDAGTTEAGLPYFVMELVHGVPITKYCDDNHLTPRERLELFVPVCRAIQHAHQKGIIHRDIKPSNVMITLYDGNPVPKVIDFGVAEATEQRLTKRTLFTQYGAMVGTLEYMSPEQAEMSALGVDTRSDIYSLGVLLYELLTGSTPLSHKRLKEAAYAEILRMIKEEEPPRPSTRFRDSGAALASISAQRHTEPAKLSKLMRGELDWIVMKCLEKDRNRRYETASGFAADVQRYLNDEAVQACPPSAGYRFRKFARRNRRILATAGVLALALVLGMAISMWQAMRATQAEGLAQERLETAKEQQQAAEAQRHRAEASERDAKTNEGLAKEAQKESAESLKDALAAVDQMLTRVGGYRLVSVPHMEPARRELLQDALKFYQRFLQRKSDDPLIRRETALAYRRLASIYREIGPLAEAEKSYRTAFTLFDELAAQSPLEPDTRGDLVAAQLEFAVVLIQLGKREEYEKNIRYAVKIAEELAKEFPQDPNYRDPLVWASNHQARLIAPTRPEEAEKILRRNLTLTNTPAMLADIHWSLANLLGSEGRSSEAEHAIRQALEVYEKAASASPSEPWPQHKMGEMLHQLASTVAANGRLQEAEKLCARATVVLDKLATDFPAGPHYRFSQAGAHQDHAGLLRRLNRTPEAEKAYRRALDLFEKLAADFPTISASRSALDQRLNLCQFLVEAGRSDDALDVYRQAVESQRGLATDHPTKLSHWHGLVRTHVELGRLLAKAGKAAEAETAYRRAAEIQEKLEKDFAGKPENRRDLAESHAEAANLLRDVGRPLEAERFYRLALRSYDRLAADSPSQPSYGAEIGWTCRKLASLLARQPNRGPEAEKLHRRDLSVFEKLSTEFRDHAAWPEQLAHGHRQWGFDLWETGRPKEGDKALREAINVLEKSMADFPNAVPSHHALLSDTYGRLAGLLATTGDSQESEQAIREIVKVLEKHAADYPSEHAYRRDLALAHNALGTLFKTNGRIPEAEQAYDRAREVLEKLSAEFPDVREYRHELGRSHNWLGILLTNTGRHKDAERAHRQALDLYEKLIREVDPATGHWHRRELAWTYMNLGTVLHKSRRMADAEKAFREAIALLEKLDTEFPNQGYAGWLANGYTQLALMLSAAGQSQEADQAHRKVLELKPESAPAMNNLAWLLATCEEPRFRNSTRAVELAKKAVKLSPKEGTYLNTLGVAHYRAGNWKDSIAALQKSIQLRAGGESFDWFFLAMTHWKLDQKEEGRKWYDKAVAWMEKNKPQDEELRRFHAEAKEVLGLKDSSGSKK